MGEGGEGVKTLASNLAPTGSQVTRLYPCLHPELICVASISAHNEPC